MKSQVNGLLQVTEGLLTDVSLAYPAMRLSLSKDLERLSLLSQSRGIGLFTLDLPHLESLLLKGLESGSLVLSGPLSQRVSKKTQVPRLYSGLWLLVFDKDANLRQDVDVTALAMLRQLLVLGKKLELDCSYERIRATLGVYHDIERKLRRPSLDWTGDSLGFVRNGCSSDYRDCKRSDFLPLLDFGPQGPNQEAKGLTDVEQNLGSNPRLDRLGLAQAVAAAKKEASVGDLPLFREESAHTAHSEATDMDLLNQIQRVADLVIGTFDNFDPLLYSGELEEMAEGVGFKHGPGAVAERLKNWEKSQFPNWPAKLQNVFPYDYCGTTAGFRGNQPQNHEVASRLICVPKTAKGPRLIAAEPTAHQWCQQSILSFLFSQCRKHLRGSFIDFKDQSKSGDLVLSASLDRKLATVDLSDASDRLTCWTVERMFRKSPSLLTALHAARTRYLLDEESEDRSFLLLRKFASQGTATTFPVMSLTMLFIALGASLRGPVTWRNIWKMANQVRVFGDDIIIPTHGYVRLIRAMELLQLKVNAAKSYVNGQFRESCGVDGYGGYDVTPVKPKTLVAHDPASCQALIDITNNLFNKGYWHASRVCELQLPVRILRNIRTVDFYAAGRFRGFFSYSGGDESHLKKRWNSRLHRDEVRVWSLSDRAHKKPRNGESALLDFFSNKHSHEQARTVSQYADLRKTRSGLQWEPSSGEYRLPACYEFGGLGSLRQRQTLIDRSKDH